MFIKKIYQPFELDWRQHVDYDDDDAGMGLLWFRPQRSMFIFIVYSWKIPSSPSPWSRFSRFISMTKQRARKNQHTHGQKCRQAAMLKIYEQYAKDWVDSFWLALPPEARSQMFRKGSRRTHKHKHTPTNTHTHTNSSETEKKRLISKNAVEHGCQLFILFICWLK